jgi:hypothetical protein
MKLYFSGVSSKAEYEMLQEAGVRDFLVDPWDIRNVRLSRNRVALDSGAYRIWKQGNRLSVSEYLALSSQGSWDFKVMMDVFGDHEATWQNWVNHFTGRRYVPVWGWGAPREYLMGYLMESGLVGIGGLVPAMRAKDEAMLKELRRLCEEHPGRFHLFGCNWLKALRELRTLVHSADTSKWLDGARYGHLIFVHTKHGHLTQAPAKVLGQGHLTRRQRCVESARAMNEYLKAA